MVEVNLLSNWSDVSKTEKNKLDSYHYPRINELFELYDKKNYENTYKAIRLLGPIIRTHTHVIKGLKKDGNEFTFFVPCLNFNPKTQTEENHDCPYCNIGAPILRKFYENAIIREIEQNDSYLKDKLDRTDYEKKPQDFGGVKFFLKEQKGKGGWTPVRVIEIAPSLVQKLENLENFNYYKNPETGEREKASISSLKYGVDLLINYNSETNTPSNKYDIQRDPENGRTEITTEYRKGLLLWNILDLPELNYERIRSDFFNSVDRINPEKVKNPDILKEYIEKYSNKNKGDSNKPTNTKIKQVTLDDEDLDTPWKEDETPVQSLDPSELETTKTEEELENEFEDLD